jgi:hypothetical protein
MPMTTASLVADPLVTSAPWLALKAAVAEIAGLQTKDGSLADSSSSIRAPELIDIVVQAVQDLSPALPHDAGYHAALVTDLRCWRDGGFGVPDFLDALLALDTMTVREDGLQHLILFPMVTQNGSTERKLEAVLLHVVWPDWVAAIESEHYPNEKFVPVAFDDFTSGYDTHSAVLFPETVAVREVPAFGWGAIFCDREAARFRQVIGSAVDYLNIDLPSDARPLLEDQRTTQETFVLWDLVHDRSHMRGDLPFDPFLVKQRLPYWLYALEELRCDLTAFRAATSLASRGIQAARLAQYTVILDRMLRFPVSGTRIRNYDGLGGQILFSALRRTGAITWSSGTLTISWSLMAESVEQLLGQIETLYRESIDRNKVSFWTAAYQLVSQYVEPHVASRWVDGPVAMGADATTKQLNDAVLPDEFPLSMFFEALQKRLAPVIEATRGIRA